MFLLCVQRCTQKRENHSIDISTHAGTRTHGYSEKRSMTKRLKTSVLDKPCSGWQTTRQPCSSQTLASTVNVLSSIVTLKYLLIVKVYCSANEESFEVQDIYNSSCCITNLKQRICSTRNACQEYANRTSLAHCTCFACREHFNHTPHEYSINQMMSPNTLNTHEKNHRSERAININVHRHASCERLMEHCSKWKHDQSTIASPVPSKTHCPLKHDINARMIALSADKNIHSQSNRTKRNLKTEIKNIKIKTKRYEVFAGNRKWTTGIKLVQLPIAKISMCFSLFCF